MNTFKCKFGNAVKLECGGDLSVESIESIMCDIIEEAGFDSPSDFAEFVREHYDDIVEFEYCWNGCNDQFECTCDINGYEITLAFWVDEIADEIDNGTADSQCDVDFATRFFEILVGKYLQ